jgi:hypothetical protein
VYATAKHSLYLVQFPNSGTNSIYSGNLLTLSDLSTDAATVWTPHWYWTLKLSLSPHEFHALTTAVAVSYTFLDTAIMGSLAVSLDLSHHTHQDMEET